MRLASNISFGIRQLLKRPLFTFAVVLTLALGIGANAAIFSLFHQVLMEPLPVPEPDRLVNLAAPGPKSGSVSCTTAGECDEIFSFPMFRDLEREQTVFTGLAAHRSFAANFASDGRTTSGEGLLVSGEYFSVLQLRPTLGRLIDADDADTVGEGRVAVLSHDYWRNAFGADPGILGQTLIVNGEPLTIVGVGPPGFAGTTLGADPRVFVPITMRWTLQPLLEANAENRRAYWVYLFARLRPGVTPQQARESLNVQYRSILREVEAPLQQGMSEPTLQRFIEREVAVRPGSLGQSQVRTGAEMPMTMLVAVAGFVLLIACVNIANLLMVRAAGRTGELAIRLSIGAGRHHLFSQLLTESFLLAVLGGAAGLVVADATLAFIGSIVPPEATASLSFDLDGSVALFAAAFTLGSVVLFGLLPAIQSARLQPADVLKGQAGQSTGRGAARFRTGLVTLQIALSMMLLVLAGLFSRSLLNISRADLGMELQSVVTFSVAPGQNGYSPERSAQLFRELETELAAIPGVTAAASSSVPLLTDSWWSTNVSVQGFEASGEAEPSVNYNEVGPGYFDTLGIPLLSGRRISPADRAGTERIALVNETFAERFGLGRDAVGKRFATGDTEDLDIHIVGVVGDTKYGNVKDEIPPLFFLANRQNENVGELTFYLRAASDTSHVLAAIPRVVAGIDPNLPVDNLRTMPQQVRANVFLDRFVGVLTGSFAGLATLLAAIGLYGVLAYAVAQRTRELGLRMALGADPARLRRLVMSRVFVLTLIGGSVGLLAAVFLGRVSESLLFGLRAHDPVVIILAVASLSLVSMGAGFLPARRASRINPIEALRYE